MRYLLSTSELEIKLQIADFRLKTQRQIVKDFQSSGIDFPIEFNHKEQTVTVILSEIQLKIADILKGPEQKLLQLLYQIDIPQQLFLDTIKDSSAISKLSELILRREAYKVYLRAKFL